jgi:hypothetical protein
VELAEGAAARHLGAGDPPADRACGGARLRIALSAAHDATRRRLAAARARLAQDMKAASC